MKKITDITLIGSGIIGLLTAKALIETGLSVSIIEKNQQSLESSWAGGGILLPLYPWQQKSAISDLVKQSLSLYPLLSQQLIQATQIDPEWNDCGLLISKNDDINKATEWCQHYKIDYQLANEALFKSFNTTPFNPLWLPTIAQARNPRLLKSLKQFLVQHPNVQFIENCTLTDFSFKNNRISQIKTSKGNFSINHLLLATGAWTGKLSQKLLPSNNPININPVKGQMLLFDANVNDLNTMILDGSHYLIPRRDGKILAGSTVENTDFNKSTTAEAKESLKKFAVTLMPTLKNKAIIHHWAGLRPGTKYGVPYIDNHPEIENLSINAGHFRNGLVMAPASAQLMTDLILKREPCLNPEPYQLTRLD
ncbi:MAG: FAD-dependent oxidoreductase [Methylococcales bacterium]|nr:FAD-dependent oxidoreductase [Methylococcales bacterium]